MRTHTHIRTAYMHACMHACTARIGLDGKHSYCQASAYVCMILLHRMCAVVVGVSVNIHTNDGYDVSHLGA